MSTTARSEMRHTEEPWTCVWHGHYASILAKNGGLIAHVSSDTLQEDDKLEAEATAARIVACVNGCAGIAEPQAVAEVLKACEALLLELNSRSSCEAVKEEVALRRAIAHARSVAPGGEGGGNG